ncbi:flavin reductase family protein [Streptomyces sp. NPDC058045]|uniref:flavin reductase family protein n=1 Tax=Streptomyces sp. NPDC058045 TaxID=3346311 RepID=UPI0036E3D927
MTSPTSPQPAAAGTAVGDGVVAGQFRQAMGRFLTGVAVVTSCGPDGPHGTTVSSLASVSLEPPMLLFCLAHNSHSARTIGSTGVFTVNVLGRGQSELAGWFASSRRPLGSAGFAGVPHRVGATGAPMLDGAVVHLDCRVAQEVLAGDHSVFIGEVTGITFADSADPLAYHQGRLLSLVVAYSAPGEQR